MSTQEPSQSRVQHDDVEYLVMILRQSLADFKKTRSTSISYQKPVQPQKKQSHSFYQASNDLSDMLFHGDDEIERLDLNSQEALDQSFLSKHNKSQEIQGPQFLDKNREFLSTLLTLTENLMKENKTLESDLVSSQLSLKN